VVTVVFFEPGFDERVRMTAEFDLGLVNTFVVFMI
jgi:hypothetical protein